MICRIFSTPVRRPSRQILNCWSGAPHPGLIDAEARENLQRLRLERRARRLDDGALDDDGFDDDDYDVEVEYLLTEKANVTVGRDGLTQPGRWVVKIGSALLTNDGRGLDQRAIAHWVDQLAELTRGGVEVVLVSSGSVAEGMTRLGWPRRPREIYRLQAAAAVGQMGLVQAYETNFRRHGLHTAQILLTHDDLSNRKRYLNARATLRTLIGLGVVAVVNENDTVATSEIRFGDNDTLGALVTNAWKRMCWCCSPVSP